MMTIEARKLRRSRAVFATVNSIGGLVLMSVTRQLGQTGQAEAGLVGIGILCSVSMLAIGVVGFLAWFCSEGS